ncbi:MAG: Mo-dependent nitrogenase C-terminal domain-containing protein [Xenococcaceae cyanobacterium]
MSVEHYTAKKLIVAAWLNNNQQTQKNKQKLWLQKKAQLLNPLREWLDNISIGDRNFAHRLCKLIPTQCPFERKIKLFGHTVFSIPPLCKLNPLYNEVVALRFRAISYLADECGEDVSSYC